MPFDLDGPNEIHFDANTLEGAAKHDPEKMVVVKSKANSGKSRLVKYPKTPWDVMGCQNHLFGGPRCH